MNQDQQAVAMNEAKLTYSQQRNPGYRFGRLPLESQLHDPLIVLDHSSDSFMSMDPTKSFKFFFVRTSSGRNGSTERALYSVKQQLDGHDLFTIDPSHSAKVSWKRTVYAAENTTASGMSVWRAPAVFNIKRSLFHPPVFSAYRGGRSGQDQDPSDHHSHTPFLCLEAHEKEPFATKYKFHGKVMSIRAPTGNAAVDAVLAVKRESKLVVLGSDKMRDIYVFLQLGGNDYGEWKWKNKFAPGPLIATAKGVSEITTNSGVLGPDIVSVEAAPGVDGRLVLSIVLSAITHLQMLHLGVNATGVAA